MDEAKATNKKVKKTKELMEPVDLEKYKEPAPFPQLLAKPKQDQKSRDHLETFRRI